MSSQTSSYIPNLLIHQVKNLHSRVHPLNSLPGFIKREDELSFGISGPKLRKLLPLIAALKRDNIACALLEGSSYSNFILGAVQLLTEHQIDYRLKLKKGYAPKIVGNLHYLLRIVPKEKIFWDCEVDHSLLPQPCRIIKEGGVSEEALFGAKTLARSILRNEEELGITFSKIFLDAGTGLTAKGLILGLKELKKETPVHVFSMKASKEEIGECHYHALTHYKSFGCVGPKLLAFIDDFAQREGIFLDPIYGAKMHYELHSQKELLDERSLIIHSGGALALSGFYEF